MLLLPVIVAGTLHQTVSQWYGPGTVHFAVSFPGNPYDPEVNDVRVKFISMGGRAVERLAYFDGANWDANFLTRYPGTYKAVLIRNGVRAKGVSTETLKVTKRDGKGFIRLDGEDAFRFDGGGRYWPFGHDLAWSDNNVPSIPAALETMGSEGLDWARIWADQWDNKNPFWPSKGPKVKIGYLSQSVFQNWDAICAAAHKSGVYIQWTLFHHGPWSSNTDSNWKENPWNAANGGFLKAPQDFFKSPEAIRLSKNYLRYVIARYSDETAVMGWELFNEVQWVDAWHTGDGPAVTKWHDMMAAYVRSLDSYHHLITTSSDLSLPIWDSVDYYQPHGYPASVGAMILSTPKVTKPLFYGEIGPGSLEADRPVQVAAIRDGVWDALLAGEAGAGQYWSWDLIGPDRLESEYKRDEAVLKASGAVGLTPLMPFTPTVDGPKGADESFTPGMGWGTSTKLEFNLPADALKSGQLSSFLQGTGHRDMEPTPVTFHFHATTSGNISFNVVGVSAAGASVVATVNGEKVWSKDWAASPKGDTVNETIQVPFPAGDVTFTLMNNGPDWVTLGSIKVPGIGDAASVVGAANGNVAMFRIIRNTNDSVAIPLQIANLPLADGRYTVTSWDLDSDATSSMPAMVQGGKLVEPFNVTYGDEIVRISK